MASTRLKNSTGLYCLEQRDHKNMQKYDFFDNQCVPQTSNLPAAGINVGKVVKSFSGKYYVKPTVDFHRLTYISIITNKNSLPILTKSFQFGCCFLT